MGMSGNVDEAISIANTAKPDVAILDVYLLGKLDGIEGSKPLWRAGVKVIFCSAWSHQEGTLSRAMEVEPVAILSKPCRRADLLAATHAAVQNKALH